MVLVTKIIKRTTTFRSLVTVFVLALLTVLCLVVRNNCVEGAIHVQIQTEEGNDVDAKTAPICASSSSSEECETPKTIQQTFEEHHSLDDEDADDDKDEDEDEEDYDFEDHDFDDDDFEDESTDVVDEGEIEEATDTDDDYGEEYFTNIVDANNDLLTERTAYVQSNIVTEEMKTDEQKRQGELYKDVLPNFNTGGVFVFWHLYKTGGSSITELIVELKDEHEAELREQGCQDSPDPAACQSRVIFLNQREELSMEDASKSVWLAEHKHKVVVYNFHVEFPSTMYPTLIEAQPILDEWRTYAEQHAVPFFAMTVLREPLGHALSFFNFFHVAVDWEEWSPFAGDMHPTEENFLQTYVPNRLCHIMYNDAHSILEAPDIALRDGLLEKLYLFMDDEELQRRNATSQCDADKVKDVLYTSFDYVGVTDRLTDYILPMVAYLTFGDATLSSDADIKKDATVFLNGQDDYADDEGEEEEGKVPELKEELLPLKKHNLSDEAIATVLKGSSIDQHLYEDARDKYEHWPKFVAAAAAAAIDDEGKQQETNE